MLNPEIYGTLSEKQARIIKGRDIRELVSFFEICHTVRETAHAMANAPEHTLAGKGAICWKTRVAGRLV